MRSYVALFVALLVIPSVTEAQSDLRKIGKFLEGLQQSQNQQGRPSTPSPRNGVRKLDPNQSGDRNRGDFNMPGFIVPPQGQIQQPFQPGPRITYPSQPYQDPSYPRQTIPLGNYVPQPSYGEPPLAPQKAYSRLPIKIRCAPECEGTCRYELISGSGKAFPYTIRANQVQALSETTDWLFRYQGVTGGAYQTYRLRGGRTYEMRRDNNRWQLYLVP